VRNTLGWRKRGDVLRRRQQLLQPVTDASERASLLVAFDTGLRSGEHIALEWSHVNFRTSSAFPHGYLQIAQKGV
jgi:integrase